LPGRIDLVIDATTKGLVCISEWKFVRINFLDIEPAPLLTGLPHRSIDRRKADALNVATYDRFGRAGLTINKWVFATKGPAEQVMGYWGSSEVDQIRKTCELVGILL